MRTKQQSSQSSVPCASTLIALAVVVVFGCSQKALAQQHNLTRTLPTTVNSEVDIGDFAFTAGSGSLWISVTVSSTGYSVAKQYLLPIQLNQSGNVWQTALPTSSTGPFNGNDFALDINVNGSTASLRLRTTASSGSVGTAYIVIKQEGANDTFTASTTSSAVSTPTTVFGSTALTQAGGNVGIGTSNPFSPANFEKVVHLRGPANASYVVDGGGLYRGEFGVSSNGAWVSTANNIPLRFATANSEKMRIDSSGNVGIGTTNPGAKLEVLGSVNVTGTGAGNITASGTIEGGNIKAKYQDLAEWVESSQQLLPGTVVVLDHTKSNQVIVSSQAYDTRVAGVISERPGIILGEGGDKKVLVATTGRVRLTVAASRGPIQIGDLLVTSDIPGVAMKSEAINVGGVQIHRPGTLVAKALEPLAKGIGQILVLLSLQ